MKCMTLGAVAGRLTRSGLKPLAAPLLSHAKFATLWATLLQDVAIREYLGVSIDGGTPLVVIHFRLGLSLSKTFNNHPAIGVPP